MALSASARCRRRLSFLLRSGGGGGGGRRGVRRFPPSWSLSTSSSLLPSPSPWTTERPFRSGGAPPPGGDRRGRLLLVAPPSPLGSPPTTTRLFSSSSAAAATEERRGPTSLLLPTRHSRKLPSPICPLPSLDSETSDLLSSPVGTLFSYAPPPSSSDGGGDADDPSAELERDRAWNVADPAVQRFERLLRGHSACLLGSLVDRVRYADRDDVPSSSSPSFVQWKENMERERNDTITAPERIEIMKRLVRRIELEGGVYAEVRERTLSQVASVGSADDDDDDDGRREDANRAGGEGDDAERPDAEEDDDDDDGSSSPSRNDPFGSSPGPTVHMYDLLLDAMALHPAPCSPVEARNILLGKILPRHEADGERDNVDPRTVPTTCSFNAVIRCASNVPYDPNDESGPSLMARDDAIDVAFSTYDFMYRNDAVHRNSATYAYMLRVVERFLPPSKTRGNIAFGLWTKATKDERVLDSNVWRAIRSAMVPSNGKEFDDWIARDVEGKEYDSNDVPMKWRKYHKKRRYDDGKDDAY